MAALALVILKCLARKGKVTQMKILEHLLKQVGVKGGHLLGLGEAVQTKKKLLQGGMAEGSHLLVVGGFPRHVGELRMRTTNSFKRARLEASP